MGKLLVIIAALLIGAMAFAGDTIDQAAVNQRIAALDQQIQERQDVIKMHQAALADLESEMAKWVSLKTKIESANAALEAK